MDAAIIRAGGVDLTHVAEACGEAGIDEAVVIGSAVSDHLIAHPSPTIVIGVLQPAGGRDIDDSKASRGKNTAFTNFDVLLRVGMAIERGVPTCLIVPPPLPTPSGIPSLMVMPCAINDTESLRLHFWALAAILPSHLSWPTTKPINKKRVDPKYFLRSLEALFREGNPSIRALGTEQLTTQLLRAAGLEFAENSEKAGPDEGFDIAVLPDRLSDEITLIQVKAGRLNERRLYDAELRLQEAVIDRRCQLGVLIYHDAEGRRLAPKKTTSLVVRIALEDLIRRLGREEFRHVLGDEIAKATERI